MNNTLKVTLMVALFTGSLFADGQIGSGGIQCPPEGCPPPCTENCRPAPAGETSPIIVTVKDPSDLPTAIVRGFTRFYFMRF